MAPPLFSGRRDRGGLKNFIRSGIEAVITGRSRKPLAFTGTWVRIPPAPPRQSNTMRSSAVASGVRSTDGVVFPFQIEPTALGFDLVCMLYRASCKGCPVCFGIAGFEPEGSWQSAGGTLPPETAYAAAQVESHPFRHKHRFLCVFREASEPPFPAHGLSIPICSAR